ncbi:hypothetical protein GCM10009000_013070 [Halobacterium noricense]|uniref:Uncharacterized protein n=1 Tax=Haladaptatus pallidirubidus TaxID=1008152 RepID=A0AAV3UCX9_9EURY
MTQSDAKSENQTVQKECDMPECANIGTKACRDPSNSLLDLCRKCRREWPVEVLES